MKHELIIKSLRDLDAQCSCGRWNYVTMTFDRDSESALRQRAAEEHALHVAANKDR